jgi:hypothetical protein
MAFFWHLFLDALAFVKNFKMHIFLHFLEEQTPKKYCQKFHSKWPLYSRWQPKLNLLLKTTNHLFSKKYFRAVLVA